MGVRFFYWDYSLTGYKMRAVIFVPWVEIWLKNILHCYPVNSEAEGGSRMLHLNGFAHFFRNFFGLYHKSDFGPKLENALM
jgi:hypothetical protein